MFLNLDCIYLCSFTKRGNLQIQHNSSLYFPPNITDISNCLNIFVQSLILTKGPQKTRISQTYMRVWEWVKSVWSPTHCDLAKSGQSHCESGWHEIFEGKIQALLIKAQCAVQWFLHRAPHQVCHIACCALSQLLVRQLTQIPADASDWQISYWQKLLFNTLPKGCTVLPALFTYYLKNPQYLWPLPLLHCTNCPLSSDLWNSPIITSERKNKGPLGYY